MQDKTELFSYNSGQCGVLEGMFLFPGEHYTVCALPALASLSLFAMVHSPTWIYTSIKDFHNASHEKDCTVFVLL